MILEWQSRPAFRLLENSSEETEYATTGATPNGSQANGTKDKDLQASILGHSIADNKPSTFDNPYARRKRLLRLFLTEHTFVLRCAELLIRNWILTPEIDKDDLAGAGGVGALGASVYSSLRSSPEWEGVVKDCLPALQKRVDRLEIGSGWTFNLEKDTTVEDLWIEAQLAEMVAISQIIFTQTSAANAVPSSATAQAFFDFQSRYNFFRDISSIFPDKLLLTSTLQSITCVASVSLLLGGDLQDCIDLELEDYEATQARTASAGFVNDPVCVEKISLLMNRMAGDGPSPAIPSIFIWSILLMNIRGLFHPSNFPSSHTQSMGHARSSSPGPAHRTVTNVYEQAWNLVSHSIIVTQDENVALSLARCAVDELSLFDFITQLVRALQALYNNVADRSVGDRACSMLLRVIKASGRSIQYGAEVFGALLSIIGGDRPYWASLHNALRNDYNPVAQQFLADHELVIGFIDEARARFPFETAPFLTLMRTVILNASQDKDTVETNLALLQEVNRFTQTLPLRFTAYDLEDAEFIDSEEERIRLTADLPMFLDRSTRPGTQHAITSSQHFLKNGHQKAEGLILKSGTTGVVANPLSKAYIVSWLHTYSPLQYLAASLASMVPGTQTMPYGAGPDMLAEDISSIIGLFTALLVSLSQSDSGEAGSLRAAVNAILGDDLLEVSPGQDLTTVIHEIFEAQLQQTLQSPSPEESLDLLIRCIQFFHAVTLFAPSRIWPLFARSRLLDLDGDGGSLVTIVTAVEMVTGRYELLLSCIRLFEALVDASFNDIVVRPQMSKALTRFGFQARNDLLTQASPTKTKTGVIMDFLRTFASVFESYRNWRYQSLEDQVDVGCLLAKVFTKILKYAYAIGDAPSTTSGLTGFLRDPAEYLVNHLLSTSSTPIVGPLIDMIAGGLPIAAPLTRKAAAKRLVNQTLLSLELCITCVRLGAFLDRKTSALQESLLRNASLLGKVYAADPGFRIPVSNLFEALIQAYGQDSAQPPSLLGYVGPRVSKDFLTLINRLGRPEFDKDGERDLWNLLSAVVSSRQQWFAIFVLTGVPPRDRSKDNKTAENIKVTGKSLLSYALDQLSGLPLEQFRSQRTIAILKFVAVSLNHWPWVMGEVRRHETFIQDICKFITKLKVDDRDDAKRGRMSCYSEASAAAVVAEILAMYLHSARQLGDTKAADEVLPHLPYLWNYGAVDPPYTPSLHANLEKNLENQCSALRLSGLKRTGLTPRTYGTDYFYDTNIAAQVLKASDKGKSSASNFVANIKDVNEELSVVDSRIRLFQQWTFLVVEISNIAAPDEETINHLVGLTRQCLELAENDEKRELPEPVAEQLRGMRLDLACLLLQRGVALPSSTTGLMVLFAVAWKTIRSLVPNFEETYASKDADRNRLLFQILFLTVQPLAKAKFSTDTNKLRLSILGAPREEDQAERTSRLDQSNNLLEVINLVIAKGFQSLASTLHEAPSSVSASDFVLLTALLQSIFHIPGISVLYPDISATFSNNGTIRYALSLFSWADQLSPSDPIYGELAILFLLELSTVPLIAETMAVEGVLASLSCANLMRYLTRPNGMGPFDNPSRLHSIWARGILPLCLNLLDAVGPQVAPEVVNFLNQYPNQLRRLSEALARRSGPVGTRKGESAMTLSIAAEVHSLALIWRVVEDYRVRGASAGLTQDIPTLAWDKATAKEDVEDWVNGPATLADRVLPVNEKDAELARQKPVDGLASGVASRLEERVFGELRGADGVFRG